MLDSQRSHRTAVELIDAAAIVADLKTLAATYAGRERELRTAVAQRLKTALMQARKQAEALLLKDRHGRRCAERLCQVQDEIIRILFEFARQELYPSQAPSEAEHMAVVATG
ncbi:MAG: bifunctional uridylyltransferase/uridylyl-removing protein, partial [Xanthobacteraceae bacterium]